MKKKSRITPLLQRFGLIILALLVMAYEYMIMHMPWAMHNRNLLNIFVVVLFIALLILHFFKKRMVAVLKSFLNAHHGDSTNIFGLFNIVFVFIQLHVLGTEFHHMFIEHEKPPIQVGWPDCLQLATFVALLFIPFFIHAFSFSPKRMITPDMRKVLVTSISLIDAEKLGNLIKGKYDFNANWTQLNPVYKSLKHYKNVNRIIFLADEKACQNIVLGAREHFPDLADKDIPSSFLTKAFSSIRPMEIKLVDIGDFNQINKFIKEKKRDVEKILKDYESGQIVFGLTTGTAIASAALTLFSIKGERGMSYVTQVPRGEEDKEQVIDFDVSVIDLDDVFAYYLSQKF